MTKEEILQKLRTDLELRGRKESTIIHYSMYVKRFQDYYDKSADQMGETEISGFLHYMLTEKKLHVNTANNANSAIRFGYGITLDKLLNYKKLPCIREYYKKYRPQEWLFLTQVHTKMTIRSIQTAFNSTVIKSGIKKRMTVHTLRHCFATHLLNEGASVFEIKKLLGHVRIDTTT